MKKMALVAAALVLGASVAFAAEGELTFTNKLETNIVDITSAGTEFAGFTEKVEVEYKSDNVDFKVKGKVKDLFAGETSLGTVTSKSFIDKYGIDKGSYDWYVEFRPWQWLTLGWSDDVFTDGSYLPVWDDNVAGGNISTENGFALILRPVTGLRIATGIDFGYWIFTEDSSDNSKSTYLDLNFGTDYTNDMFSFGFAARDVLAKAGNDWDGTIGVFASFTGLKDATFRLGYAYNDKNGVQDDLGGKNLITFGASYSIAGLGLDLDFAWAGGDEIATPYDIYVGFLPCYEITDAVSAEVEVLFKADLSAKTNTYTPVDSTISITPAVSYTLGKHTFKAGFGMGFTGNDSEFTIPVSWKYKFTK